MKYQHIVEGEFISRPNRFIAYVSVDGETTKVHVKNTGRCKELLTDHARIYLEKSENEKRSTAYDLVAVEKAGRLINMDSNAPNKAVYEWLQKEEYFKNIIKIKPEMTYGNSRFDFYVETNENRRIFIEVKGVTLEENGIVRFPDAPSDRAVKHLEELCEAMKQGYESYVLFVIQMKNVRYFKPNDETHKLFAETLRKVAKQGVKVLAYDCEVTPQQMDLSEPVRIILSELDEIVEPLLNWYDKGHRELPWRLDPTPYHVWLSEIMLQQTRVEAVKRYYTRFLDALPTIQDLAKAKEDMLLKLWEGLGYYNRVRNLQKAAIEIVENYSGEMPASYEALLSLPGIGSYTAGAIGSIAFSIKRPAVDGNVLRVLSRLRCDDRNITDAKVKQIVENELICAMPENRPGDFNQALMELGAMVCLPGGEPICVECPWENICKAHKTGREMDFPIKEQAKSRTIEKLTVLVIKDNERIALHKRPNKGLLAGLYELPNVEGHKSKKQIVSYLRQMGLETLHIEKIVAAKHIFSHKEWHMIGYAIRVDELSCLKPIGEAADYILVEPQIAERDYAIPSAFSAYTEYIGIQNPVWKQ